MAQIQSKRNFDELLRSQVLELSNIKSEKNFKLAIEFANSIKQMGVDMSRKEAQEWNDFMTCAIGDE